MSTKQNSVKKEHLTFDDYTGRTLWDVEHSGMNPKRVRVCAPNEVSALVTASKKWRVRWQAYDIYAYANIVRVYSDAEK